MSMQHQYWVTKKSVLRKLGGKEDECVVSSDAELDAKLELFKSINDCCIQLQRIIDLYQERLCYLAQEENALGRYLKECSKNEKNSSAGQLLATAGKALAYTGHQRLTIRPPLVRLHHEVETFRGRAVSDTRVTVSEMEKARTEYRAALSWMKSASSELDPDSGNGLEPFRKAQSYVKQSKTKFDKFTLACLQKVDLLAAARCNMFSHALVPYQNALKVFETKSSETLIIASSKLGKVEPYDFSAVSELATGSAHDKDKSTFFNAEYSDNPSKSGVNKKEKESAAENKELVQSTDVSNLLGEDFSLPPCLPSEQIDESKPSSALLDLSWSARSDFISSNSFMPSSLIQEGLFNLVETDKKEEMKNEKKEQEASCGAKKDSNSGQMSWLSLFAELDPLANAVTENNVAGDRA